MFAIGGNMLSASIGGRRRKGRNRCGPTTIPLSGIGGVVLSLAPACSDAVALLAALLASVLVLAVGVLALVVLELVEELDLVFAPLAWVLVILPWSFWPPLLRPFGLLFLPPFSVLCSAGGVQSE